MQLALEDEHKTDTQTPNHIGANDSHWVNEDRNHASSRNSKNFTPHFPFEKTLYIRLFAMAIVATLFSIVWLWLSSYEEAITLYEGKTMESERKLKALKSDIAYFNALRAASPWPSTQGIVTQTIEHNSVFNLSQFYQFDALLADTYSQDGAFFLKQFDLTIDPDGKVSDRGFKVFLKGEKVIVVGTQP